MIARCERTLLWTLALAAAVLLLHVCAVDHAVVLHLLPLAVLVVPLLLGRYPGERLLARLLDRGRGRRAGSPLRPRAPWGAGARRRRVMAWSLAVRPPPRPALGSHP